MENKKYGEFNNFDDFFNDILSELEVEKEPAPAAPAEKREKPEREVPAAPVRSKRPAAAAPVQEEKAPGRVGRPRPEEESTRRPVRQPKRDSERPAEEKPVREAKLTAKAQPEKAAKPASTVGRSVPFFAAMAVITVIAWCLPLRPTESVSEKRMLDKFPEFSTQALFSGDYYSDIESWFSDTFTFREKWISFSDRVERLHGIKTVSIHGEMPVTDAIPIPTPVPQTKTTEPAAPEKIEKPKNTEIPEDPESTENPEKPENSENPAVEELGTGEWGGVKIDDQLIADKGAKLQIGDAIFVYPGFSRQGAERYADLMNKAGDLLEGKANFYCVLAPHNATTMLKREDREKYGFVIEEDAYSYMYSLMNDNVNKVNVIENLQKHNDEYIAFRSDPHWTALGAYYAYEEWCKYAGKTPVPISEYKEYAWEDFFGTYFYTAGEPKEIKNNPDTVFAYEPPGDVHLYLDFANRDGLGEEYDLLLDRSVIKRDQYITFLSGDGAKATFVNNDIDDDSACLVLKTSFGNPFVYYLSQHYHKVYVVDMRYYGYRGITSFVDEFNVDDVIVIHAADLCYSDAGLSTVGSLIH